MEKRDRILIIRLGALGDLILCFQAFSAIRRAHPDAKIALLTTPVFAPFARRMPWIDQVLIDERAPVWRVGPWARLLRQIRGFKPHRVYDLQGKRRQTALYMLLGGPLGPQWSGAAPLCSHPRLWPPEAGTHFTDFIAAQLARAGIANMATGTSAHARDVVDVSWLEDPLGGFALPEKFVMLIPSCAAGRDYKRWPAAHYAALANLLKAKGFASIAVGKGADRSTIHAIQASAPHILDFSDQTSLGQLAAFARRSEAVVGNDTGPMHLAAAVGVPTLTLMSDKVDPLWSAPQGPRSQWLQGVPLADLGVDKVFLALQELMAKNDRTSFEFKDKG